MMDMEWAWDGDGEHEPIDDALRTLPPGEEAMFLSNAGNDEQALNDMLSAVRKRYIHMFVSPGRKLIQATGLVKITETGQIELTNAMLHGHP